MDYYNSKQMGSSRSCFGYFPQLLSAFSSRKTNVLCAIFKSNMRTSLSVGQPTYSYTLPFDAKKCILGGKTFYKLCMVSLECLE